MPPCFPYRFSFSIICLKFNLGTSFAPFLALLSVGMSSCRVTLEDAIDLRCWLESVLCSSWSNTGSRVKFEGDDWLDTCCWSNYLRILFFLFAFCWAWRRICACKWSNLVRSSVLCCYWSLSVTLISGYLKPWSEPSWMLFFYWSITCSLSLMKMSFNCVSYTCLSSFLFACLFALRLWFELLRGKWLGMRLRNWLFPWAISESKSRIVVPEPPTIMP